MNHRIFRAKCAIGWAAAATGLLFLLLPSRCAGADTFVMDDDYAPEVALGPWAGDLEVGPHMKAAGRCLRESKFVCQDLRGAVFDGCDLSQVVFLSCDLAGASFKGAHLSDAYITDCRIRDADFSEAVINALGGAMLSDTQLKSTRSYKTKDLHKCIVASYSSETPEDIAFQADYDLRGANLADATLMGDLRRCDFTDAWIDRIQLKNGTIDFGQIASTSNFKRHQLWGMTFTGKITGKCDLSGVDMSNTQFPVWGERCFVDANISGCILSPFGREDLAVTKNFKEGDLSRITLGHADLSGTDFSGQNLTGAKFALCSFSGAKLDDAVITDAHFAKVMFGDCTGLTLEQIKSTWNYKHGRMAGVVLPKELAEALQKEKSSSQKQARE